MNSRSRLSAIVWLACLCAAGLLFAQTTQPAPEAPSPEPRTPEPDDVQPNIFDRAVDFAQRRVVKIYGAAIGREHGYATGVLVSGEGHIVTSQGIYLASSRIRIVLPDGSQHFAEVVRRDDPTQLALLKIEAETPDYFELAAEPNAEPGDWVLGVSNAFKVAEGTEQLSVNMGIVSMRAQLDTKKRAQDFDIESEILLVDAITANPGAPGGALVTIDGQLAGVVGKVLESQATNTRLNYAIPIDIVARFVADEPTVVEERVEVANGGPGTLGIRIFKLSGRRAPAYVDSVRGGSPAAAAGLRKDDLVLTIDDEWVKNVRDYEKFAEAVVAGKSYKLTVKRGAEVLQFTVTAAPVEGAADE